MSIKENIQIKISRPKDNVDSEFEIIKGEMKNLDSLFNCVKDFIDECGCEETKECYEIDFTIKQIEKIIYKILMKLL